MEVEAMTIDDSINNYIIPSLKLDDGWFFFSSISKFLSSITPNDMPLIYCILELLRDAFQSKVSILRIILEALKMESGFLCLILIIFLISIIPLGYTVSWFCSRNLKIANSVSDFVNPNSLPNNMVFHEECREKLDKFNCRKRAYVLILQILITICVCSILSMFIVNEQISMSISDSGNVIRSALKDAEYYVKSSNHYLQAETFDKFDKAKERIKIDLEDIDKLLGERITREISIQTGIDMTFEATHEILDSTRNLSMRVQLLNDIVIKTLMLATDAAAKVDEIHVQLSVIQRQCSYRDRPLCDTLRVKSFEEMGLIEKLRILNYNTILQKLRSMNDNFHDNNLKKLSEELTLSKKIFRNYSHQLQQESVKNGEEIMKQMTIMRNGLNETVNKFSLVIKHVLDKIGNVWQKILPMIDNFNEAGDISWMIGLISCASTLVVTLFLLVPMSCSCCHVENLAGISFQMSACVLSIFCIFLGFFSIFEALIGGHGEVFICRALYEKPEFIVIGRLFDSPGIIYNQPPTNGIFAELLVPVEHNSKPFSNTLLMHALNECEVNKSAYYTFQIDNLMDFKNTLNYENYADLLRTINGIRAPESSFTSLTQRIQYILNDLMHNSDSVNFTSFRLDITQISPEKEMINFIDQMQRVSLQISDVNTATRMTSLSSVARRIHATILQPLEILKNEIVFQLTALELQIEPWILKINELQKSFNESQNFLDKNSFEICSNYSEHFRSRVRNNLELFKTEMIESLQSDYGCRSLFDIFDGLRLLTCQHIVEPINGLFLISFIILLLWTIATPFCFLLSTTYNKIENIQQQLCQTNSHHSYAYSGEGSPRDDEINRQVSWSSRPQASIESNW